MGHHTKHQAGGGRRRLRQWLVASSVAMFLVVLAVLFVLPPVGCTETWGRNAAGVTFRIEGCRPSAVVLALVGAFMVGWLAALLWALRRRRSRTEPESTDVPLIPGP